MADKKISELDLTLQINNDAVFPMSQENAGEPTTFKAAITQLGTKIAENMTFSNLQTTSKTLVGAINELSHLGNPILLGTTAPTSSQGANGNIYVQYTEGTGGAPDTVDSIYAKIDGTWCEIETGGGGGTTDYEDLSNKPQVNSVELVGNKSLDDLGIMPASLSKTVSGSLVHITDGADNIPVKSLVSEILAVESGNGQPKSPTNPYTISGFDRGIITRCGKNIADVDNSGDFTRYDGATRNGLKYDRLIGTFAIQRDSNSQTVYYAYQNSSGAWVEGGLTGSTLTNSFTSYGGVQIWSNNGTIFKDVVSGFQLEVDTATTYEAYNGNTYTFAFGQTVYGGHFDNKGNLVVTHGTVDLGDLTWNYYDDSGIKYFHTLKSDMKIANARTLKIICPIYQSVTNAPTYADTPDKSIYNANVGGNYSLCVKDFDYTSASDFKTAMNGIIAVYPLATPITLSITSQDIPTLLGENNIFSNCGDVEVTYYTDNADEIVEVAKATASTPLHNYSTDEQVVGTWIDGKPLYQKTIVIAGASLTAGQSNAIPHGISDIDYVQLVNGTYTFGDGEAKLPLPFADNYKPVTESVVVIEAISSSTIRIGVGSNYQGAVAPNTVWMTVQYTKTTDFASST